MEAPIAPASGAPPRPARYAAVVLALALTLTGASACAVPRSDPPAASDIDFSTLPNLRRAREALEDRIAREREYAAALMQQLDQWIDESDRIFKQYLQAEHDYQLISSDLAGTQEDLNAATEEFEQLQAQLATRRDESAALREELLRALEELARLHGLGSEIEALAARLGPTPGEAAGDGDGDGEGEDEGEDGDEGAEEEEEEGDGDEGAEDEGAEDVEAEEGEASDGDDGGGGDG